MRVSSDTSLCEKSSVKRLNRDSPCELSSISALLALTMSKAKKTFGEFGKLAEDGPLSEEEVIQTAYMINRAVAHKQLPQVTDLLLLKFAKDKGGVPREHDRRLQETP